MFQNKKYHFQKKNCIHFEQIAAKPRRFCLQPRNKVFQFFILGVYNIKASLWSTSPSGENAKADITCETGFETLAGCDDPQNPDCFIFSAGSIFTFAVTTDDKICEVKYDMDSTGNSVNIFLLLPQYFVITVGEVMNSVTGLEFSYTQASKDLKSVVQSFWLLTVCVGNIIDVFFVEIKLWPTQVFSIFKSI